MEEIEEFKVPKLLNELTGKHFCIKCRKKITAKERNKNDDVCNNCAKSPITNPEKLRCEKGCKHYPHDGKECGQPIAHNPVHYCNCEG